MEDVKEKIPAKQRVMYLDKLKLFLTILVIAHHTCQAYTTGGAWIVKDTSVANGLSSFLTVNMTFFMSAFFFISGYFIPDSRKNRTKREYVERKMRRLLVPILLLLTVLVPIYFYLAYYHVTSNAQDFFTYYVRTYWGEGNFSYEHGWFLISLFCYSMIYLVLEKGLDKIKGRLTGMKIVAFMVLMAILTALIRLIYPIDQWVDIAFIIGIEPAHFPQYFLWFLAGTLVNKNDWMEQITPKMGRTATAIAAITILPIYLKYVFPSQVIDAVYAIFPLYESIMSVTIILSLVYLSQKYLNHQNTIVKLLGKYAFGAYIVHNTYVIIFQVSFCQVELNGYIKFILATTLAAVFSFGTVAVYQKIMQFFMNNHKSHREITKV